MRAHLAFGSNIIVLPGEHYYGPLSVLPEMTLQDLWAVGSCLMSLTIAGNVGE